MDNNEKLSNKLPITQCEIPMPNYVKASGNGTKCKDCIHRGVCAFSKTYENYETQVELLGKEQNFQHFCANTQCGFYEKSIPKTK